MLKKLFFYGNLKLLRLEIKNIAAFLIVLWAATLFSLCAAADLDALPFIEGQCASCHFPVASGCPDPRVYKNPPIQFANIADDHINDWHNQKGDLVSKLAQAYEDAGGKARNHVLAGLQVICQKDEIFTCSDIVDLPLLFVSGNMLTEPIRSVRYKAEERTEQEWMLKSADSYIKCENVTDLVTKLNEQLRDLFSTDTDASKLGKNFLQTRSKEVMDYEKKEGGKKRKKSQTPEYYFHSEQALNLYLEQSAQEYMCPLMPCLLEQIKKAKESYFRINVIIHSASYNEMCLRCGTTFFRQSERKDKIRKVISDYINAKLEEDHNDFKVNENMLQLVTISSGVVKFSRPRQEILERQSVSYNDRIDVNVILAHVVQRFAEPETDESD